MRFKKGLAVLTASVMTLSALSGCSNKVSKDKFSTTVGATYGDQKIYLEEFQFYTKLYQPQFDQSEIPMLQYWYGLLPQNMSLEQLYSEKVEMSNGHYMTPTQMLKEYVVKVVYQTRVLNDYAKENGITLSDDDQKKIDEKVKEYTEGDSKYLLEGTTVSEETIKRILTENALAQKAHDKLGEGYDKTVDRELFRVAKAYYFTVNKDSDDKTDEKSRAEAVYSEFKSKFEEAGKKIESVDLKAIKDKFTDAEGTENRLQTLLSEDVTIFVGAVAAEEAEKENEEHEEGDGHDHEHESTVTQLQKEAAAMAAGDYKLIDDTNAYYIVYLSETDNEKSTQQKIDAEYEKRKEAKFAENYAELLKTAPEIKVNNTNYDANIVYSAIEYPTQPTEPETTPGATEAVPTTAAPTTEVATTEDTTTTEALTTEEATEAATEEGETEAGTEEATEAATAEGETEAGTEEATEAATAEGETEAPAQN